MITIICIVISLFIVYLYALKCKKRKLPEGAQEAPQEYGLPIIGALYGLEKPMHHYLMKLGHKHGPIFRMNFGMREVFVLNDYRAIKMCFKDDAANFSGRWNGHFIRMSTKNSGILFNDDEPWARQRAFILTVLREFGLGKSRTDQIVQNECGELLKEIISSGGGCLDFTELIHIYTANIISVFLMNKRYSREDPIFRMIVKFVDEFIKKQDNVQFFLIMFPLWDNSAFCSKLTYFFSLKIKKTEEIHKYFLKEIKEHADLLDLNSQGDDFMDRYLIEKSRTTDKAGSVEVFTDFDLMSNSFEMFVAGYETTSMTLVWSLLFLAKYLEIQKKMHSEIVALIGMEQLPCMNDKRSLPFTQAVMDEILRMSTVVPLSIFHRTFHDTVIDGNFIPKNSFIFPNLYACHRDATVWEKPFQFYPQHFLSTSETGEQIYRPREELIPFGMGKRQCLGEFLARTEFFIFLLSIIQKFSVTFAEDVSEEMFQKALLGEDGVIRFSNINNFKFEKYTTEDK